MSFTLTLLHRLSGEHESSATTAFILPEDVPEILILKSMSIIDVESETHLLVEPYVLNKRIRRVFGTFIIAGHVTLRNLQSASTCTS